MILLQLTYRVDRILTGSGRLDRNLAVWLESTVDKVTSSAKELLRPEELAAKLLGDPAASDDSHTDAANTNEGGKGE